MRAGRLRITACCQPVTGKFPKPRNREFKRQNREFIRRIRELPRVRTPGRKAIVGMPEKVSGVRRKDQGFRTVRGFQEEQPVEISGRIGRRFSANAVSAQPILPLKRPKPAEPRRFLRHGYWTPKMRRVGGGGASLERTRLRWKFPDNPRFTGKNHEIAGNARRYASNYRMLSASYRQIP